MYRSIIKSPFIDFVDYNAPILFDNDKDEERAQLHKYEITTLESLDSRKAKLPPYMQMQMVDVINHPGEYSYTYPTRRTQTGNLNYLIKTGADELYPASEVDYSTIANDRYAGHIKKIIVGEVPPDTDLTRKKLYSAIVHNNITFFAYSGQHIPGKDGILTIDAKPINLEDGRAIMGDKTMTVFGNGNTLNILRLKITKEGEKPSYLYQLTSNANSRICVEDDLHLTMHNVLTGFLLQKIVSKAGDKSMVACQDGSEKSPFEAIMYSILDSAIAYSTDPTLPVEVKVSNLNGANWVDVVRYFVGASSRYLSDMAFGSYITIMEKQSEFNHITGDLITAAIHINACLKKENLTTLSIEEREVLFLNMMVRKDIKRYFNAIDGTAINRTKLEQLRDDIANTTSIAHFKSANSMIDLRIAVLAFCAGIAASGIALYLEKYLTDTILGNKEAKIIFGAAVAVVVMVAGSIIKALVNNAPSITEQDTGRQAQ